MDSYNYSSIFRETERRAEYQWFKYDDYEYFHGC